MTMDDRRQRRLAELRAEEAAQKARAKEATDVRLSNAQDMRQRIEDLAAKDVPDRADKLARTEGIEYGAAVRRIISEDEAFHHLPGSGVVPDGGTEMERIVNERMNGDKENYA